METVELSSLDISEYDPYNDVIEIEGTRFAGAFFRELGFWMPEGQLFRFERRVDGVVTITRITGDQKHE